MSNHTIKNILMLKKRTMNIDEFIRENEALKLKLEESKSSKEFRDFGTQTSKKNLRNTSTQTQTDEEAKPKKNFISFFNTKGLFNAAKPKPTVLVKFYQKGRLGHGKDVSPAFELPGHRSFELNPHEFTLPHAREYGQELEQQGSEPRPKSPKKKARKLIESPKKESAKKESPKKEPAKKSIKETIESTKKEPAKKSSKETGVKIHFFSQNSHFQMNIFHKIHIYETLFSHNSHFSNMKLQGIFG